MGEIVDCDGVEGLRKTPSALKVREADEKAAWLGNYKRRPT
jgi:hypothetical protein